SLRHHGRRLRPLPAACLPHRATKLVLGDTGDRAAGAQGARGADLLHSAQRQCARPRADAQFGNRVDGLGGTLEHPSLQSLPAASGGISRPEHPVALRLFLQYAAGMTCRFHEHLAPSTDRRHRGSGRSRAASVVEVFRDACGTAVNHSGSDMAYSPPASERPLVALVGPTASGKSSLAIAIAERFRGEVLNCDSLQMYRWFDIGTAKTLP